MFGGGNASKVTLLDDAIGCCCLFLADADLRGGIVYDTDCCNCALRCLRPLTRLRMDGGVIRSG